MHVFNFKLRVTFAQAWMMFWRKSVPLLGLGRRGCSKAGQFLALRFSGYTRLLAPQLGQINSEGNTVPRFGMTMGKLLCDSRRFGLRRCKPRHREQEQPGVFPVAFHRGPPYLHGSQIAQAGTGRPTLGIAE